MYIKTFDELFNTHFIFLPASHDECNSSFYFTEGVIAVYCSAHCKNNIPFFDFQKNDFL